MNGMKERRDEAEREGDRGGTGRREEGSKEGRRKERWRERAVKKIGLENWRFCGIYHKSFSALLAIL